VLPEREFYPYKDKKIIACPTMLIRQFYENSKNPSRFMIEELKNIAFWIHIEPLKSTGNAIKVDTVLKVLSDICHSYNQYLEIEFLRNDEFRKVHDANKKILDAIKEELSLRMVDLNYSSFEAALAPDILDLNSPLFKNEVLDWKKETFRFYKEEIIEGDYENTDYLHKMLVRYKDEERIKIFMPLFSSFGDGTEYRININDYQHHFIKTLIQPHNSKEFYIPRLSSANLNIPELSVVRVSSETPKAEGNSEDNYQEVLGHDIRPFKPDVIRYESLLFVLTQKLDCEVDFEDNNYIIRNDELDLVVWGESRKEVEDSFSFNFYWMYLNYYLEEDKNLSDEALQLKATMKLMIKSVINSQ
jgi:hypothetical protein